MSAMTYPWGRLDAEEVNPVTPPVAEAVNLNLITPEVNVLGLRRTILVAVLSHCMLLGGIGKILGVGFTVTTTVLLGPSLQPVGLTGVIT